MLRQDYIMRMIATLGDMVRNALDKINSGFSSDAISELEEAVGYALEMSPSTVFALSPQSLSSILSISNTNESLALYVVFAIEKIAAIYEQEGNELAGLRHEQAQAISDLFGFSVDAIPDEFSDRSGAE